MRLDEGRIREEGGGEVRRRKKKYKISKIECEIGVKWKIERKRNRVWSVFGFRGIFLFLGFFEFVVEKI